MIKSTDAARTLLVLATVLTPLTQLRFGLIGVGELLILLLFAYQAVKGVRPGLLGQFPLTTFWLAFIFMNVVGAAVNSMLFDVQSGTWAGMAFDLSAYVFMLMTTFTLERLASHDRLDVSKLLRDLFFGGSLVLTALFVISQFTPTLFGLPLTYYDRFVPLAANLHQISLFLVPLPFLGIVVLRMSTALSYRLLVLVLIGMDIWMAVRTGSTKATLAIPLGACVLAYAYSLRALGRPYLLLVNSLVAAVLLVVSTRVDFIDQGLRFFTENDRRGARQYLYQQGMVRGFESFLVGRGPGQHVEYITGAYVDAHQTILTVFLQTGIIGVIAFGILGIRVVRRASADPALLAGLAAITTYALGGDILRRLPVWILLFIIVHHPLTLRPAGVPRRVWRRGHIRPPRIQPALQGAAYQDAWVPNPPSRVGDSGRGVG